MSQFRFVLVSFSFTAVLIFAVYLRGANNRIFYELSEQNAELSQLKQELGARQLVLEGLLSPAASSQRLKELRMEK
jgi:hypothetical protein